MAFLFDFMRNTNALEFIGRESNDTENTQVNNTDKSYNFHTKKKNEYTNAQIENQHCKIAC